jgi:hypothetical protein
MDNAEALATPVDQPMRGMVSPTTSVEVAGPAAVDADDRGGVFRQLVKDDADITGLVAYSIYKQNMLDWLTAFEKAKSRGPNEDELSSYIIGEATARRLATYRHLAEATLSGNGPGASDGRAVATTGRTATRTAALSPGLLGAYALLAALLVFGFILAAHFTVSPH